MVTFVDYELKPLGKTLATAPEFGARMREMSTDTTGSPILRVRPCCCSNR